MTNGLGERPICPGCLKSVDRNGEIISCNACRWSSTIDAFRKSHAGNRLVAGRMKPFFEAFVDDFKRARDPRLKMRLIDILIHRCHGEYERSGLRPGAINLIGGKPREVVALLDRLAGYRRAELAEEDHHDAWVNKVRGERQGPRYRQAPTGG